jgi:hypothetical protein
MFGLGLGLWCFNATFNNIVEVRFIGGGNQEYPEKTTDLSQVTDKLNRIMLYPVHLTTSVEIGTDYIGSCKSNYPTIMTRMFELLNMSHVIKSYFDYSSKIFTTTFFLSVCINYNWTRLFPRIVAAELFKFGQNELKKYIDEKLKGSYRPQSC